jgi:hypothetical protein
MDWDEEAERIARSYAGLDFREAKIVERRPVYMCFEAELDLGAFIDQLQSILESVPAEFRETAKAVYERGSYDSSDCFKIVYQERETPEEVAGRVRRCWEHVQERRARDRQDYERLKSKFER